MLQNTREQILRDLHPIAENAFRGLTNDLKRAYEKGQTDRDLRPVDGFRTPREQEVAFNQRPVVEHLGKWFSPHSYGFAVKFRGVKAGGNAFQDSMSAHDVAFLHDAAQRWGLVVDPNHAGTLIHPFWYTDLQPLIRRYTSRRMVTVAAGNDNSPKP